MEIAPYSPAVHAAAVGRLNSKLAAAQSEFLFPTAEPTNHGSAVTCEHFVAIDQDEALGGYILKHQKFFVCGETVDLDNMQLPLTLGLIDNRFSHVSAAILFDALGRNEFIYCLGMGSQESRLVKLLTAAGWQHCVVPFYFRIRSGNRFARNIRLPPARAGLQKALRVAGHLSLAGPALGILDLVRGSRRPSLPSTVTQELVPRFGAEVDRLFDSQARPYCLVGDRRSEALHCLYPESNATFLRIVVREGTRLLGWAVLLDTAMRGHKYFGDLRVGTIADAFAAPGDAFAVVAAADRFLSERGVDLIVSNQLHPAWGKALLDTGYREGPSNFFFYFSPALAERLQAKPDWRSGLHINRGDGDGPIHL